ncbi:thiamine phosphate synthase [Candidatus Omnitrophota bacterium]
MIRGYYFITDSRLSKKGNKNDVKNAIEAGVTIVQYRHKTNDTQRFLEEAKVLRELCRDITFIINDRVDIALAVDADGVHIGQEDISFQEARRSLGNNKIIGLTVHNPQEAIDAQEKGADYLGVSPIFETITKEDARKPLGVLVLRDIKKVCGIPIAAAGGITLENAKDVIEAGADAICAISAVVTKSDTKKEIERFQVLFSKTTLA